MSEQKPCGMNFTKKETTTLVKPEPTYSQRFTSMVVKEFSDQVGVLQLTPYQERLAQHMFVAIDAQLKSLEAKRKDQNKPAIIWQNINMAKLAIDAVHRVELGLDALIPNHIHPIPYLNSSTKLYDLDLQIGYVGKDCYKRKMALDPPKDIRYELVYAKDKFKPIKKSAKSQVENYDFEIDNPFDRGEVVGGFGYIIHDDPTKNTLILVSKEDMDKAKQKAQSDKFWGPYPKEMQFVVLVRRTTAKITIDPEKVNASYMKVEIDDTIEAAERQIAEKANQDFVDVEPIKKEGGDSHETGKSNDKPDDVTSPPPTDTVELPTGPQKRKTADMDATPNSMNSCGEGGPPGPKPSF